MLLLEKLSGLFSMQGGSFFYQVLNYFFFFFHSGILLFNCLGWAFRSTRKWNLLTLLLTSFSWFFLGIWYGWGYCLCTDWHWEIREKLGFMDHSNSYVHFLFLKLTGIDIKEKLVDQLTAAIFFMSLVISIWLNINDYRSKRKSR